MTSEAKRKEMQERRTLLLKPLTDAGVLSYRVNRSAIAAALLEKERPKEDETKAESAPVVANSGKEEIEKGKKTWRSEILEMKSMVGLSLSSLVSATTDRSKIDVELFNSSPRHGHFQVPSLTQVTMSSDMSEEYAPSSKPRPRANFNKPVKPRSKSERAAKFAAHGIMLSKNVLPWKATPSRPVKFSLLDPDELRNHPGIVDGGDPWCSVFWGSKAADIHAGCHYRPIIL
jgi:hypothetical protein